MHIQSQLDDRYFTRQEAADYLRCSLRKIDYLIACGELRAFQPVKKLLLRQSDLDVWVTRHERQPAIKGHDPEAA